MTILGIDIGATGIKGAPVNVQTGKLLADRYRIDTPDPATPRAVARVVHDIVKHFKWTGPIGCGLPCVIKHGEIHTTGYLSKAWMGKNARRLLARTTHCPVTLLNDADAAGLAETHFGAGARNSGTVLMITLGTGIGTSLFVEGRLVPNVRLGHLIPEGKTVIRWVSDRARRKQGLSWTRWAVRLTNYLRCVEDSLFPDLIVVGGGTGEKYDNFLHLLKLRTTIVPARFGNEAGIIGAALAVKKGITH